MLIPIYVKSNIYFSGFDITKMFVRLVIVLCGGIGINGKNILTGWPSIHSIWFWHSTHKKQFGSEFILNLT